MAKKPVPDSEPSDLFRQAMRDVNRQGRRYRQDKIDPQAEKSPAAVKLWSAADAADSRADHPADAPANRRGMPAQTGSDTAVFTRPGVPRKRQRKLHSGKLPVQDRLDLHGLYRHQAESAVDGFLQHAIAAQLTCVLIIHGKGLHSGEPGGVLKPLTIDRLQDCPEVMAFCPATPQHGGNGATCVLLKHRR